MIERSQLRPERFIFNRKRVHFRPEVPFSRAPFQAWNGRLWYWERYDRLLSRYELADILVHILCVTFSNTTKKRRRPFFRYLPTNRLHTMDEIFYFLGGQIKSPGHVTFTRYKMPVYYLCNRTDTTLFQESMKLTRLYTTTSTYKHTLEYWYRWPIRLGSLLLRPIICKANVKTIFLVKIHANIY